LTDSKNSTKSGRFKEILGSYDPRKSVDALETERIKYWLSQGASPTETIHNLLVEHKIIDAKKIHVAAKSKKAPVEVAKEAQEAPAKMENAIIEPVVEEEKVEEKTEEKVEEEKAA